MISPQKPQAESDKSGKERRQLLRREGIITELGKKATEQYHRNP